MIGYRLGAEAERIGAAPGDLFDYSPSVFCRDAVP